MMSQDAQPDIHRLITEQLADAVIHADVAGNIVGWNAAAEALFGYTKAEAVGQSLDLIIPEQLRAAHWVGFNRAMARGKTQHGGRATVTRATTRAGVALYVEMSFAVLADDAGKAIGSVAVARDVTQRHAAERQARAPAVKPDTPAHPPQALATRAIHGHGSKDAHGSPHPPIYNTTTFAFDSTADLLAVVEGKKAGSLYTRYGSNPSIVAVEKTLAGLEGAEAAWAFCSGMAALTALFLTHGRAGIVCLGDAYGGTMELLTTQLPLLGLRTHLLLGSEMERLDELLADGVKLVFFETPTNPTLELFDIRAIADKAHAYGALVAIDNTFASPVNQRPLELGADVVMHSATKYLGGHSDLTAGALMGTSALLVPIGNWRKNLGSAISPEAASLLARSLRTLVVRVRQHNLAAQRIAEAMARHPLVVRVFYPGLPDFPGHALAKKQMHGFGGMLTIAIKGDGQMASRVADALRLFALAPSLGGAESLVTQPCTTSHHDLTPDERSRRGISDAMLRLSVGLEDPADLIADLEQALAAAQSSR